MNLRSLTITAYVKAAAKLYTNQNQEDPFNNKTLEVNYPDILIKALEKYKKIDDRREVITNFMFKYIARAAAGTPADSLENSPKDWIAWSCYSGP